MKEKSIYRKLPAVLALVLMLLCAMPVMGQVASAPDIHQAPSATPAINGARIIGSTPGRPFLFLIPATGEKPLAFSAEGLPAGLSLDPATGIITGSLEKDGRYEVTVTVSNARGKASRKLTIVGGKHQLALTPPMGWNSWNVWGLSVSDAKVRAAADAMVSSGLKCSATAFMSRSSETITPR